MKPVMKKNAIKVGKIVLLLVSMIVLAMLLQACGQKGDLILPDDAAKAEREKKKKQRLF